MHVVQVGLLIPVFCMSGETLITYLLSEALICLLYSMYKTYSLRYVFYVILKNKVMSVIAYRLVLLPHIREGLL